MTKVRIGLVVEGPTDLVVFEHLLGSHLPTIIPGCEPVFVDLQPTRDASAGKSEGGWEMVYQWCLANPPDVREDLYFGSGLFGEGMNEKLCDVIVIHLDGDVCSLDISRFSELGQPDDLNTSDQRGSFIVSLLKGWLWPGLSKPDTKHIEAPVVESTEAWLIAALSSEPNPEGIADPNRVLLAIEAQLRGMPIPATGRRINTKRVPRYVKLSRQASDSVEQVHRQCVWFSRLSAKLQNVISSDVTYVMEK